MPRASLKPFLKLATSLDPSVIAFNVDLIVNYNICNIHKHKRAPRLSAAAVTRLL